MAQIQASNVIVSKYPKFVAGTPLGAYKPGFLQHCQRTNCGLAAQLALSLSDVHLHNKQNLASFDLEVPTISKLKIFVLAARVVHSNKKNTILTGGIKFAGGEQSPDTDAKDFTDRFSHVIDTLQRNIESKFDERDADGDLLFDEDNQATIDIIREYVRVWKVLLPEEITSLIKYLELTSDEQATQQTNLRAEVIAAFGNAIKAVEAKQTGSEAFIFVLEKTDGLGGTGSSIRTKTLEHVHAWGITNTDHPETFSSGLEQYLKKLQKFGIEAGIVDEIKTELIDTLLQDDNRLSAAIIAVATTAKLDPSITLEQLIRKIHTVAQSDRKSLESQDTSVIHALQAQTPSSTSDGREKREAKQATKAMPVQDKKTPKELHALGQAARQRVDMLNETTKRNNKPS